MTDWASVFYVLLGSASGLISGAVVCVVWELVATPQKERPSSLMFAGLTTLSLALLPLGGIIVLNHSVL